MGPKRLWGLPESIRVDGCYFTESTARVVAEEADRPAVLVKILGANRHLQAILDAEERSEC